jgi:putative exosortase-associated protein (TIGR04073 family)
LSHDDKIKYRRPYVAVNRQVISIIATGCIDVRLNPEELMRKFIPILAMLMCFGTNACIAFETDFDDLKRFDRSLPFWKLGRGVVNVLGGPQELLATMTNNAIKGSYYGSYDEGLYGSMAGSVNGYIGGFFPGLARAVKRMTTGALEIATFWKPEYGPTMDPTYGTRCMAFGERDYYDPSPYWNCGPPKW